MFPQVEEDRDAFRAITKHIGVEKAAQFSDDQKLLIYREYKKLRAVILEPSGEKYKFRIFIPENQGTFKRVRGERGFATEGVIDAQGNIAVLKKQAAILNCPICLAADTRIDTPSGPVAVKDLKKGMLVWTSDARNVKTAVPILKTVAVPVAAGHSMVHLVFSDGKELWASPGHPTADGRTVDLLNRNDLYEGERVEYTEVVPYEGPKTYDLLPAGETGFYWANGILLVSTLK